jgi:hypothetical protein
MFENDIMVCIYFFFVYVQMQNNAKGGYNAPEKTQNKSSKDWFHMVTILD